MPALLGNFISSHVYDGLLNTIHPITAQTCVRFIDCKKGVEAKKGHSYVESLALIIRSSSSNTRSRISPRRQLLWPWLASTPPGESPFVSLPHTTHSGPPSRTLSNAKIYHGRINVSTLMLSKVVKRLMAMDPIDRIDNIQATKTTTSSSLSHARRRLGSSRRPVGRMSC